MVGRNEIGKLMPYFSEILSQLHEATYVRLFFQLEFSEPFTLPRGALLQLRREFFSVLRRLKGSEHELCAARLHDLFTPPLPAEQLLRKQVKSPPPGVVLTPACLDERPFKAGDTITLPVFFVGMASSAVDDFFLLLTLLGKQGLYCGCGRFVVNQVQAENSYGDRVDIEIANTASIVSQSPVCDFKWMLENHFSPGQRVNVQFLSPLRLMKAGRPVFKMDARLLVDGLAKRIAAVIAYHCQLDIFFDQKDLDVVLSHVITLKNNLKWQDWRQLQGAISKQKIGGIVGELELNLGGHEDLIFLLYIGQYVNLGKSAAFGLGQYKIEVLE